MEDSNNCNEEVNGIKRILFKINFIFLVTAFLFGCDSQKVNNPLYSELNDIKNHADIWSSINYQIITDKKTIEEIEPSSEGESILLNILVRFENKGQEKAEAFNAEFDESVPLKYIRGSGGEGISHGYLDENEIFEFYRHYTFNTKEDVEEFIAKSTILVEWNENGVNKQLFFKLPSEPTVS